jgi:hypothetical protein
MLPMSKLLFDSVHTKLAIWLLFDFLLAVLTMPLVGHHSPCIFKLPRSRHLTSHWLCLSLTFDSYLGISRGIARSHCCATPATFSICIHLDAVIFHPQTIENYALSLPSCGCRLAYYFYCLISINLALRFMASRCRLCGVWAMALSLWVASAALTLCCSTLTFHALCL